MPFIRTIRKDIEEYLQEHNLWKKWIKAKKLFEKNPRYPSLNTELLEPKENLVYSLRLDKKYRALFYIHEDKSIEILKITKHYR